MPEDSAHGADDRPASVAPRGRSNRTVTPAIAGALVVLAASFALSVAFVLANGGLDLPSAERPAGSGGVVGGAPSASATGAAEAGAPSATTEASAPSGGSPAPSSAETTETPAPSATATTAEPSTASTPRPSSNRYALLRACPSTPNCWIYVVRQGDNLFSIAKYFGVPLNVVQERNPWTATTALAAGQKLLLPPPTR